MGSLFFMSRCSVEWWFCCCLNFDHAKPHESSMPAINFVGVKCTGSTVCVHLYKCDALRDGCMRRSFSPFSLSKFTDCTQLSNRRADGTELWVNNRNGISSCGIGPLSQVFLRECLFNPAFFFFCLLACPDWRFQHCSSFTASVKFHMLGILVKGLLLF